MAAARMAHSEGNHNCSSGGRPMKKAKRGSLGAAYLCHEGGVKTGYSIFLSMASSFWRPFPALLLCVSWLG